MTVAEHPFLSGNFAPIHDEIFADSLQVIGELPHELHGMFLRTGPNPQFSPGEKYHWFDGDGMLHGVLMQDGKASYRNRWVRTAGFDYERAAGKKLWTGFGEMPQFENPPHGMMRKNVANTALVHHAGKLLALWEAGEPYEISLPDLETVGPLTWQGALETPFTAHPKVDPVTGEMMFFGYSLMAHPFLHYGTVSADGQTLRVVPIEIPRPVMMHDFAVTENYSIFLDLPLVFEPMRMLEGQLPFHFNKELPSRYGLLPRHGDNSQVRWFEGPPCFMFHTLNAWEEGDEVILVGCRTESTSVLAPPGHSNQDGHHHDAVGNGKGQPNERACMHRWRFNLATGQLREEELDDVASDFPRLDAGRLGRASRYGYSARFVPGDPNGPPLFDGVIKYDYESGSNQTHRYGPSRFGGEAVFAPRPDAGQEDDGWVLTMVHDEALGQSELLVADARHMETEPVARVVLPHRVPYGFHAEWIGGDRFTA